MFPFSVVRLLFGPQLTTRSMPGRRFPVETWMFAPNVARRPSTRGTGCRRESRRHGRPRPRTPGRSARPWYCSRRVPGLAPGGSARSRRSRRRRSSGRSAARSYRRCRRTGCSCRRTASSRRRHCRCSRRLSCRRRQTACRSASSGCLRVKPRRSCGGVDPVAESLAVVGRAQDADCRVSANGGVLAVEEPAGRQVHGQGRVTRCSPLRAHPDRSTSGRGSSNGEPGETCARPRVVEAGADRRATDCKAGLALRCVVARVPGGGVTRVSSTRIVWADAFPAWSSENVVRE